MQEAMIAGHALKWTFVFYFLAHIPWMLFNRYAFLSQFFTWYTTTFKDPLMGNPEPLFRSLLYMETILELIFFPTATYAFWKVAWPRSCLLISPAQEPWRNTSPLSTAFAPFLVVPLLMLLLVRFSPAYNQVEKEKKK
ncbi:sigma intracellular receptor 2-like [Pseudonaja textilis]|uniref:sigma intracellular receptor 2-like n=1 Tax=Pseudonaja textilis TaxID=8673 RepID=UPI000EAAC046|nr:sigma intracellular receptor 2-like [Pseudonaja textilis]